MHPGNHTEGHPTWILAIPFSLGLVALCLPAPKVSACAVAHRIRLFPLGTVNREVVVAEIDEYRDTVFIYHYRAFDSRNLYWIGKLRLRRMTVAGRIRPGGIALGKTASRAIYYHLDTRRALDRALQRARSIPDFKPFGRPTLQMCGKGNQCGVGRVRLKNLQLWFELATTRGRLLDKRAISEMAQRKFKFGFNDDNENNDVTKYARRLSPAYAMSHRWGARRIFTVALSTGFSRFWYTSIGWQQGLCRSVRTCIPPAEMSHHQVGRDALLILPAISSTAKNRTGRKP